MIDEQEAITLTFYDEMEEDGYQGPTGGSEFVAYLKRSVQVEERKIRDLERSLRDAEQNLMRVREKSTDEDSNESVATRPSMEGRSERSLQTKPDRSPSPTREKVP